MPKALLGVLALFFAACTGADETAVNLELHYAETWSLDQVRLSMAGNEVQIPIEPQVHVLLPDEAAGLSHTLEIVGLARGNQVAHATVTFTPVQGKSIDVVAVLTKLPCGAWCTAGTTRCFGDGVAICEERDDDSCLEWSEAISCDSDAPSCSLGECRKECIDECAPGETRCDGPNGVTACGQDDSDRCYEWQETVVCEDGETCSAGVCNETCQDACTLGETACLGRGVVTCGDVDGNNCTEWSPVVPCENGTTCSQGACQESCVDDCTQDRCNGSRFSTCGQFDLDDCLDLSLGVSCISDDLCYEGVCTHQGCDQTPKVCNDPPDSVCLDENTLRSSLEGGTCSVGACDYPFTDKECPNGCKAGACLPSTCSDVCEPEVVAEGQDGARYIAIDDEFVYWTNFNAGSIMRWPKQGGDLATVADDQGIVQNIAVDTNHVYWNGGVPNDSFVRRRSHTNDSIEPLLQVGANITGLALDDTHIYYGHALLTFALQKRSKTDEQIDSVARQIETTTRSEIVVDDTAVYWLHESNGAVFRRSKAGGTTETVAEGLGAPSGLALDDEHMYWADYNAGTVMGRKKSGGEITTLATNQEGVEQIEVDTTHIYWVRSTANSVMRRSKKPGSKVETLATNQDGAFGIVLDETHVYWTNTNASTVMRLSRCACDL